MSISLASAERQHEADAGEDLGRDLQDDRGHESALLSGLRPCQDVTGQRERRHGPTMLTTGSPIVDHHPRGPSRTELAPLSRRLRNGDPVPQRFVRPLAQSFGHLRHVRDRQVQRSDTILRHDGHQPDHGSGAPGKKTVVMLIPEVALWLPQALGGD